MTKVDKIRKFFDSIDCGAIAILKTNRAGKKVDNSYGVDFELAEYAIIHKNKLDIKRYNKLIGFELKEKMDIIDFEESRCASISDLIKEMESRDNYQILWREK